jgi:hypothetical protein
MKADEIYAGIAEVLSNPVAPINRESTNAKKLAAAREAHDAELARVRDLIEGLQAIDHVVLFRKLSERLRQLVVHASEISNAENYLVASSGANPEVEAISERIGQNMRDEFALMTQGLAELGGTTQRRTMPTRYIRADATAEFYKEIDAAEAELKKLEKRHPRTETSWPAGRITSRMQELQAIIDEWPKTQKLCRLGERVHAIREERRRLIEERDELQKQQREKLLAVA